MYTRRSPSPEVHPLVFLGSVLYALALITLLFLYVDWVSTLAVV